MFATCPTDPQHAKFVTTAHVMEDWVVLADGTFVESLGSLETTHAPDPGNVWTCYECGSQATVVAG